MAESRAKRLARNKAWKRANRPHVLKYYRLYYEKHRAEINSKTKMRHIANRERDLATKRRHYQRNKERIRAKQKAYHLEFRAPRIKDWRREAERSISEMRRGETRPFETKWEADVFCKVGRRMGYNIYFRPFKEGYKVIFKGRKKG